MLKLRDVEIFQPYGDATPLDLLWAEGVGEAQAQAWEAAELVRIAKLGAQVLGMYAMQRGADLSFLLHGVVVDRAFRRQGLGRWLVGHAIGVAESKGGRRVLFPGNEARRFFAHIGFVADPRGQRFDLIRE